MTIVLSNVTRKRAGYTGFIKYIDICSIQMIKMEAIDSYEKSIYLSRKVRSR